ncbi:hypothetical protein [Streptomyces sp. NBC_00872]|uniref:hypothetical protein n=1 Tax=Streptomyces sp. NBC_00872 TaxID=2903686 RepID=UPI003866F9FE|nr:hypothetical protein OG214_14735 [Streptomyces sp. NBC_00872]
MTPGDGPESREHPSPAGPLARGVRWPVLYARSRQVPVSLTAVLVCAVFIWSLPRSGTSGDPRMVALLLTSVVAVASTGLSGQDLALDRTAAIRWAPRRAAHVLLIAALAVAVLLALSALSVLSAPGGEPVPVAYAVRNSAGPAGAAAIGAAVWGGRYAWTVPFGWCLTAFFVPVPVSGGVPAQVATWMLQPSGTPAASWTSAVLAVGGGLVYALAGPRR